MAKKNDLSARLRKNIPESLLTDDIAYDDIVCASGVIKKHIQETVDDYNLTPKQVVAAISLAMEDVVPDERLFSAIDGTMNNTIKH